MISVGRKKLGVRFVRIPEPRSLIPTALLVDDADGPGNLTTDRRVGVLECGEERLEGPGIADGAEGPGGLTANARLGVSEERDERWH
jgi:hypothetical protein